MARKRIGILTGGGDVPGLNAVIKSVTYRGSENDIEVVGLRRGWEALTHLNLEDPTSRSHYLIPMNRENTRTIDRRGGTVLHSSRTNPSKMQKLPDHLVSKDFPVALSAKGGIETKKRDLTGQVLANLSGLGIEHRSPTAATTRLVMPPGSTTSASRSSPSRRRWTTTSAIPSTASQITVTVHLIHLTALFGPN